MTTSRFEARRRFRWRRLVGAAAIAAVVLMGVVFVRARSFDGTMPSDLASVRTMPITFPDGRNGRLGDLIRPGMPTVINLWASWCGPCRREAPHLASLRQHFGPQRLNFVALNVRDEAATPDERAAFLKAAGLPPQDYAILDASRIRELVNAGGDLVPRTLVFGSSGKPIASITGYKPLALRRIAGLIE